MALSDLTKKVNSTAFRVYITSVSAGNEFAELQDARLLISHAEFREPTTAAGNVYYSGQPENILSGTLLYSSEQWDRATTGWAAWLTRTNGEVALKTLVISITGADSSNDTFTFTNVKCSVVDFSKPIEGGIKIGVQFVLPADPA